MIKKLSVSFVLIFTLLFLSACDSGYGDFNTNGNYSEINNAYSTKSVAETVSESVESDVILEVESTDDSSFESENSSLESVLEIVSSESTESVDSSLVVSSEEDNDSSEVLVTVPETSETESSLVWVSTKGGTKYHIRSNCSGMKNPEQITKESAISEGFEPCKKCYK